MKIFMTIVAVIAGSIALRWVDRLFPTLTNPPSAVNKIF